MIAALPLSVSAAGEYVPGNPRWSGYQNQVQWGRPAGAASGDSFEYEAQLLLGDDVVESKAVEIDTYLFFTNDVVTRPQEEYTIRVRARWIMIVGDPDGQYMVADVGEAEPPHEHSYTQKHDAAQHWQACSCGERLNVANHIYGDWRETKPATETEAGSRERDCTVCDYVQTETIPMLEHEHSYGDWQKDETQHWKECRCGEKTEVGNHTFDDWTITKEPTTTETGSRERTCSICKYTQEETIPVHEHSIHDEAWKYDDMAFVTSKIAAKSAVYFAKQQKDLGAVNGYIEEMMEGQKVVKVFCHETKSVEQFRRLNQELRESADKANTFSNITMPVNMSLGNISYVLCAVAGAIFALNGYLGLTLGTLVSFLTLNKNSTQPVSQISQQMNSIVMAMAGAQRIFDLMDEKAEVDNGYVELVNVKENPDGSFSETGERTNIWAWKHPHQADGSVTYQKLEGDITFHDVDFGYEEGKVVLHNISLHAAPGRKIAFVGSTGAGKTTITNLLNRFYDIADGKIRYDGININKIQKGALRRSLGMVLQDTHLFTGP